jgi:hypothetical protein
MEFGVQRLCKISEAGFIGDGKQGTFDGDEIGHSGLNLKSERRTLNIEVRTSK